jgi:hypothetical protein
MMKLSSGRECESDVTLSNDGLLCFGNDGASGLCEIDDEAGWMDTTTPAERREIALRMIGRWKEWAGIP